MYKDTKNFRFLLSGSDEIVAGTVNCGVQTANFALAGTMFFPGLYWNRRFGIFREQQPIEVGAEGIRVLSSVTKDGSHVKESSRRRSEAVARTLIQRRPAASWSRCCSERIACGRRFFFEPSDLQIIALCGLGEVMICKRVSSGSGRVERHAKGRFFRGSEPLEPVPNPEPMPTADDRAALQAARSFPADCRRSR